MGNKEPYSMPSKPYSVPDTTKQNTAAGPHGGGIPFHQAKITNNGFVVHPQIDGHTQKLNFDKPKK